MASDINKPFLPFEIITNILTRLPIKSIVKFQCVCKAWKHLFKTQSFISQHTLHSAHQNPFLLIHAYDHDHHQRSTLRLLDHNMQTDEVLNTHLIDSFKRGWTIVGSSNGFICVELAAEAGRSPTSYLVWNPVSNEVIEVPPTLHRYSPSVRFGYSSVVDDYKIVRFYFPDPDFLTLEQEQYFTFDYGVICGVEVFSLRSGSWKEIEFGDLNFIFPHAAYVNGTIFWCGYGSGSPLEMLVAFDIATEVFTITPIITLSANVDVQKYGDFPHRLCEYGNKLAMCDYYAINSDTGEYKGCYIILWVFEECGGESGKSYRCT